jgi:hypothetical protein
MSYDPDNNIIILWDTQDRRVETPIPLAPRDQASPWLESELEESGEADDVGDLDAEWEQRIPQCLSVFDTDEYRPDGPDANMVDPDVYFEDGAGSLGQG